MKLQATRSLRRGGRGPLLLVVSSCLVAGLACGPDDEVTAPGPTLRVGGWVTTCKDCLGYCNAVVNASNGGRGVGDGATTMNGVAIDHFDDFDATSIYWSIVGEAEFLNRGDQVTLSFHSSSGDYEATSTMPSEVAITAPTWGSEVPAASALELAWTIAVSPAFFEIVVKDGPGAELQRTRVPGAARQFTLTAAMMLGSPGTDRSFEVEAVNGQGTYTLQGEEVTGWFCVRTDETQVTLQ